MIQVYAFCARSVIQFNDVTRFGFFDLVVGISALECRSRFFPLAPTIGHGYGFNSGAFLGLQNGLVHVTVVGGQLVGVLTISIDAGGEHAVGVCKTSWKSQFRIVQDTSKVFQTSYSSTSQS